MSRERDSIRRGLIDVPRKNPELLVIGVLTLAVALSLTWHTAFLEDLRNWLSQDSIEAWVARAGFWGPVLIVGVMTIAIVATPIPSAPIALAAGAAYGHVEGTAYIVAGAELGAMIAFGLARLLGRDVLLRWLGDKLDTGLLGSQNTLSMTVFQSRLLPFVSFDLVSYAAGLSCLHFWRFSLATLAGIIPASFLLAHFGGDIASAETNRFAWAGLGLSFLTGAPLVWSGARRYLRRKAADRNR